MKNLAITVAAVMGILAFTMVNADVPNYKYAEFAYGTGELELTVQGVGSADVDEDGFEIEGSYSFIDNRLWLFGSYTDLSGDEAGGDIDWETTEVGVGLIFSENDTTAIDVAVRRREDKLSVSGAGSDDIAGVGASLGIRSNVSDTAELFARIGFLEGDYKGSATLDLGAVYNITDSFALSLSYEWLDYDDEGIELELSQIQLGARMKF